MFAKREHGGWLHALNMARYAGTGRSAILLSPFWKGLQAFPSAANLPVRSPRLDRGFTAPDFALPITMSHLDSYLQERNCA